MSQIPPNISISNKPEQLQRLINEALYIAVLYDIKSG